MPKSPKVDAYLAERTAPFALPILTEIRARVHAALPGIEEGIKWGMPAFLYKGKTLCMMAAFKAHAILDFPHGSQVTGGTGAEGTAMGEFGRMTSVDDLPKVPEFAHLLARAAALIDAGVKSRSAPKPKPKPVPNAPADFAAALSGTEGASAHYDAFSAACKREYVEWIEEAKRPETRTKRIAQAVAWIAEGKTRNWKYRNC